MSDGDLARLFGVVSAELNVIKGMFALYFILFLRRGGWGPKDGGS